MVPQFKHLQVLHHVSDLHRILKSHRIDQLETLEKDEWTVRDKNVKVTQECVQIEQ